MRKACAATRGDSGYGGFFECGFDLMWRVFGAVNDHLFVTTSRDVSGEVGWVQLTRFLASTEIAVIFCESCVVSHIAFGRMT